MRTKYKIKIENEIVSSFDLNVIEGLAIEKLMSFDLIESEEVEDEIPSTIELKPITPMYLRIVLEQMNLLSAIEAELAKPENKLQQVAFEYALEYRRNHPFITSLSDSIGLTSLQVDQLFITANQLKEMYD
mgnify:CR=1 FL=1